MRRLGALGAVLFGVSVLTFGLGALAPGDPAELQLQRRLGERPTQEQLDAQREAMGLDRPIPLQYAAWAARAAKGDLGHSWGNGRPVSSLIMERLPRTALLGGTALAIAVLIAVPLGVLSADRQNSLIDHSSRVAALLGSSLPSFFSGYLLMLLFGVYLGVLPVFGFDSLQHLVLPAVTLAAASTAILTRLTRSALLEALGEDYITVARAKGVPWRTILLRHGLRNALIPIITVLGIYLGHLLSGAVIVEWVFSIPGLGKLGVDAIYNRDYPLIQGFVLFAGVMYVLANLLVDIAYVWVDPRVRLKGASG